ncbi:MAG: UDP-N-acetylmuramoyl-tripeptide--D-alanyl-D-alanine ligase, partial [Candidatus Aminicenantes bacterium]|nr:UDP-N-acetylmuramoyl-tripeptide--D-alanyl-D-alanine ligase [Candidatus Aminicenantes bacterium]
AAGAVVSHDITVSDDSFVLIRVKDTIAALQDLARSVLARHPAKVVGITGSVGKTTTKEFTAALLGTFFRVHKSGGNLNNHLGLALSILRLEAEHEIAVLEMGMSGAGEIRRLTGIAPPDVAVVTNVAPVHLAFLETLEAVGEAKGEIIDGLKPGGTAVLNGDDPWGKTLAKRASGRVIFFGFGNDAEIRASGLVYAGFDGLQFRLSYDGLVHDVRLPFLTGGQVENLLAALGVARAFGLRWETLQPGLAALEPAAMRGRIIRLAEGITVVDDTYNSSPRALEMALQSYVQLPAGRYVAVLGDMLELGPEGKKYHEEAGRNARRLGWDVVASVGPSGRWIAAGARAEGLSESLTPEFTTSEEAAEKIPEILKPDDLVLVKGSRGVRMEPIVERLISSFKEH